LAEVHVKDGVGRFEFRVWSVLGDIVWEQGLVAVAIEFSVYLDVFKFRHVL
jgi:hypothetical protein